MGTVAFLEERDEPGYEVFVYRLGGELSQLTTSGGSVGFGLDWSPENMQIAYVEGRSNLVIIDPQGNELSRHTLVSEALRDSVRIEGDLEWLPDGQTIFANRRDFRDERNSQSALIAIDLSDNSMTPIVCGSDGFDATWAGHASALPLPETPESERRLQSGNPDASMPGMTASAFL